MDKGGGGEGEPEWFKYSVVGANGVAPVRAAVVRNVAAGGSLGGGVSP